jgi:hypothetical protein
MAATEAQACPYDGGQFKTAWRMAPADDADDTV